MRPVSSSFHSEVIKSVIRPAVCVNLYLDSGTLNLWTGNGELYYNGITYLGTGACGGVSSIEDSGNLAADGVNLTLSGIPNSMLSIAMNEDYRNRRAVLTVVLFNEEGNLIGGNLLFVGRMDVFSIERGAETATISVSLENHLISFERARIRRYTSQDQILRDPTDIGFQYISKVSQDLSFTWGSAAMTLRGSSNYGGSSATIGSWR